MMEQLTCVNTKDLPFGTWLRVVSPDEFRAMPNPTAVHVEAAYCVIVDTPPAADYDHPSAP